MIILSALSINAYYVYVFKQNKSCLGPSTMCRLVPSETWTPHTTELITLELKLHSYYYWCTSALSSPACYHFYIRAVTNSKMSIFGFTTL